MLTVEADGEPRPAIEIATGATIADPFRPIAVLVELLDLRAAQLRQARPSRRRQQLGDGPGLSLQRPSLASPNLGGLR
jgi:hypothetical protein